MREIIHDKGCLILQTYQLNYQYNLGLLKKEKSVIDIFMKIFKLFHE